MNLFVVGVVVIVVIVVIVALIAAVAAAVAAAVVVVVVGVLDATLTHESVHTRTFLKVGEDQPPIYATIGGLTPGSGTLGVSATPRALEHSQL